jgi:hypothetical protein
MLGDDLGGGGRSGSPEIGDKVSDGEISFVADGGDDRNVGVGDGASKRFVVEGSEVFKRSSAASEDDEVNDAGVGLEPSEAGAEFGGGG